VTLYKLACYLLARWRFHDYAPQPVTYDTVNAWLDQFPEDAHKQLFILLRHVTYLSHERTLNALTDLNRQLLKKLASDGIPPNKVIYVQVDDAGSSSHWVLATLKHAERLENLGCTFLDSKNVRGLSEATDELEKGAIVYVDDFAGSGDQFCLSRDFVAQHTVGNFVEFFLLPCICEEAVNQLVVRGVEPRALIVHNKKDRILHPEGNLCAKGAKQRLLDLSDKISAIYPLGYRNLGTMAVLFRNSPDTTPLLLRGNENQDPYVGILPRTSDLPPVEHYTSTPD
jgi:hypothetical protein